MADDVKEAEQNLEVKPKARKSELVGRQAKPSVLADTTKIDVDTDKKFQDMLIMAGMSDRLDMESINRFTNMSDGRDMMYSLIDTMFQDSSVSAIARTYVEDTCEMSDNGHIVWAESDDPKISKFVNYLLDVSNVDKNIYGWVNCLIKYGDVYLKLYRESDYEDKLFDGLSVEKVRETKRLHENMDESVHMSFHKISDKYSYYIEMVADPGTMFELTKFGKTYGYIEVPNEKISLNNSDVFNTTSSLSGTTSSTTVGQYNYRLRSDDINIYQADDYVHGFLDDDGTRFPETVDIFVPNADDYKSGKFSSEEDYNSTSSGGASYSYTVRRGKSLFYDAYKIWREKQLLEAAALLSRLTRSSVIRKVSLEAGNTSREKSAQMLRAVKEMFEQKTAYSADQSMSEYNNPGAVENFIYHIVRNNVGSINVETIGGDYDPKSLIDLDWWNNKFYGSFGIPKQYFGWTDDAAGFNGGSALTVVSSVYAKAVKRIQNAILQAITTAIDLFLLDNSCKSYLNNYVLKMKTPLTQEELQYRENLTARINAISSMNALFADVETKSTRLNMLKAQVATLNYGDELIAGLDDEIKVAKEAEKKAKEDAETAAQAGGELDLGVEGGAGAAGGGDDLNLDLGDVPAAPDTPQESFMPGSDATPLVEDVEFLDEDTDLLNPNEIEGGEIDFSSND